MINFFLWLFLLDKILILVAWIIGMFLSAVWALIVTAPSFIFWVNYSFNGNIRTCSLIISHILHIYVHRRSSHSEFLTNSQQVHVHRNVFLSSFIIVDESGLFSMRAGVSTTSNLPKTRPRHVHIKAFHSKPILKKKLYLQMYKASCIFSCNFFSRNNKVLFHFTTFHKLQYWHILKMFWITTKN